MRLAVLALAGVLAWSGPGRAEGGVRLRAIHPKRFYRPGDRIAFEMRCPADVASVRIDYNPTLEDGDAGSVIDGDPNCPFARFEIEIPRDFIGRNRIRVLGGRLNSRPVTFEFEVRSDVPPSDLWFSTDSQNEGCNLFYVHEDPPTVGLFSVLPDGTRLDLCREGKAVASAVPPEAGTFRMKGGVCTLTLGKPGPLRIVASYRGLRKEWPCLAGGPTDAPRPTPAR